MAYLALVCYPTLHLHPHLSSNSTRTRLLRAMHFSLSSRSSRIGINQKLLAQCLFPPYPRYRRSFNTRGPVLNRRGGSGPRDCRPSPDSASRPRQVGPRRGFGGTSDPIEVDGHAPPIYVDRDLTPNFRLPKFYNPQSLVWEPSNKDLSMLRQGDSLKIVSWNLYFGRFGLKARTCAALANLKSLLGPEPQNLIVMLQELRKETLEVILEDKWVQQNFILSDTEPPCCPVGESSTEWIPTSYFTLMMVSRVLPVYSCFRLPFITQMGRDALVIDIPVCRGNRDLELLRLCTTHLESLYIGKEYRFQQLTEISALLKGQLSQGIGIYAGMVGGDMNSGDPSEHHIHHEPQIRLRDVWEDEPAPTPPVLKPFQKDMTYGRARGNTWGYQSERARTRKRLDKFFYTGSIKTFAMDEAQDTVGRIGRFGIGWKTEFMGEDIWVSDHFGIAVGIKIV